MSHRLRAAAARAWAEARSNDASSSQARQVASALEAAARACAGAAQSLQAGVGAADLFVLRHVGGTARTAASGLRPEDVAAIRDYTSQGYVDLNAALRSGSLEDVAAVASRSAALSAALQKMPAHAGTVLRGSSHVLGEDVISRYEPGEVVVEPFLSTTRDPEREFGGNVLWIVQSRRGRAVSSESALRFEEEVLFDRFSRFEVLAKDFDDQLGRWVIYMEEID